ncbi:MAG: hypothetical protein ACFCVK_06100 [Acidimicrobiales bacterium]
MTTATSPPTATGGAGTALVGLYRLLLRQQVTAGRIGLAGVMIGILVLTAALINGNVDEVDRIEAVVGLLWVFGLGLLVPILSLVLASSSLGQLVEDETLVYLWLRPNPRWMLALAAWLASLTVAVPAVVPGVVLATLIGTGDGSTALAAAVASMLATAAYTGLFTLFGLLLRRSLIWGLLYVFIWEFFVARVGQGAARLSINTYPSSVLAKMTDLELPLAERALTTGVIVSIVVPLVAVALTSWRLDRANVA